MRRFDLNLLIVFDALFEERSVTRAAQRLSLTQPTISGQLQRLRDAFADQLFVRTSHGVVPTPRAEAIAGPVKQVLADARQLVTPHHFVPLLAEGTIRIGGSDYVQHAVITPLLRAVREQAPGLRMIVSPRPATGVAEMLLRGDLDLCISLPDVADLTLPSQLLFEDRYVCTVRKAHPLSGKQVSVRDICAYEHLIVDPTGRSLSGPIDTILASTGHRRRVYAAVPSFPALFELLGGYDFVAFCPERLVQPRLADFRVLHTEMAAPRFDVTMYWHPRVNHEAQHVWLRSILGEVAREAVVATPNC